MSRTADKPEPEPVTYFVVQTYVASAKGLVAEEPRSATDVSHAMRLFHRYKPSRAGVVAFSRTGSPARGDWGEPVLLARHGQVAAEVEIMEPFGEIEGLKVQ